MFGKTVDTDSDQSLTLVKPELTPEGIRQAAIDMYRTITGKEPSEEDLAEMDKIKKEMEEELKDHDQSTRG